MGITSSQAYAELVAIGHMGRDFHALPSSAVESIIESANRFKYRKPRNANGSRGRYWYALLHRRARPLVGTLQANMALQAKVFAAAPLIGRIVQGRVVIRIGGYSPSMPGERLDFAEGNPSLWLTLDEIKATIAATETQGL
jgi:hypothetical protein